MSIGVLVGLVSGLLTCLVTETYCHRSVAHRAFRVHPVLATCLDHFMQVYGGVHPQRWAGVHRLHHRYADTPLDPHSPVERNPLLVLIGTPYLFAAAAPRLPDSPDTGRGHVVARFLIAAFWFVVAGWAQTLLALAIHFVLYFGIMGMVNTVGHRSGRKPHPDVPGFDAPWLALLLLGHGYHNSHHAHPTAARVGRLDPVWPLVRLCSGLGLIELPDNRGPAQHSECCGAQGIRISSTPALP